jgi:hypothetical protein
MNGAGTRVAMEPLRRFVEIAQSKRNCQMLWIGRVS